MPWLLRLQLNNDKNDIQTLELTLTNKDSTTPDAQYKLLIGQTFRKKYLELSAKQKLAIKKRDLVQFRKNQKDFQILKNELKAFLTNPNFAHYRFVECLMTAFWFLATPLIMNQNEMTAKEVDKLEKRFRNLFRDFTQILTQKIKLPSMTTQEDQENIGKAHKILKNWINDKSPEERLINRILDFMAHAK